MSDSVWPHRRQPTRLPHPWDSPGKNTGVGCHFFLQCMKVKSESKVTQSCPTPSNPMDYSLPGSSVHGIFQAGGQASISHIFQFSWHSCSHLPAPRVTPATQEAPMCSFTQQSAIQYCSLSYPLGHVFLFIFSAQLITELTLGRYTQVFFKCLFLVFLMYPLTMNSELSQAFQPPQATFPFRILVIGSLLVFLWSFGDSAFLKLHYT